jgi:[CysO sulfur-carrier protein]-S-L-cysteine hydrolase
MVSRSENLLLPRHFYIAMVQHAQAESPNECCGLFAGVREGDVLRVLARHPLVNEAASPIEFFSQPRSMFDAVKAMRKDGHKILAIYHSHPTSEPIPSKTDLERNFSEDVINFIIGVSVAKPIRNAARRIVEGGALAVLAMRQRSLAGAASHQTARFAPSHRLGSVRAWWLTSGSSEEAVWRICSLPRIAAFAAAMLRSPPRSRRNNDAGCIAFVQRADPQRRR